MAAETSKEEGAKKFKDSMMSLALLVAMIVIGRIFLLEPFKIPSGSMEPTLIGHEDFGDRILTNKLAYVSLGSVVLSAVALVLLALQGLTWSVDHVRGQPGRSRVGFVLSIVLVFFRIVKSFRFEFYESQSLVSLPVVGGSLRLLDWFGLALLGALGVITIWWYVRYFSELKYNKGAVKWAFGFIVVVLGGMGFAYSQDAIAGEPKRFDVPVFEYSTGFADNPKKIQDINYIKRLVGLPGERIMISGGDLFLFDKKEKKYRILRKWQERSEGLQDVLWFPVSRAFEPRFGDPYAIELAEANKLIAQLEKMPKTDKPAAIVERMKKAGFNVTPESNAELLLALMKEVPIVKGQLRDLSFPWAGADSPGAKLEEKALALDGTAPVTLAFKFPIQNIYLKQGRWPFKHSGCPAANLPGIESDGIKWRNPNSTPEDMTTMVANTWDGMQCPNCRRVYYPILVGPNPDGTSFFPNENPTRFWYGGNHSDGDLKIEVKLTVEAFGSLHLEAGNTLRRAEWNIPDVRQPAPDDGADPGGGSVHFVTKKIDALKPGEHTITLSYVDGTVIAALDGVEVERRLIDVAPTAEAANLSATSLAKLVLTGVKGRITALNLSRDLFYTNYLQNSGGKNSDFSPGMMLSARAQKQKHKYGTTAGSAPEEVGNLIMDIPPNEYLMMGDNSPSSSDGRCWGFVPRERLMGRAWVVGWPLSRWKLIK